MIANPYQQYSSNGAPTPYIDQGRMVWDKPRNVPPANAPGSAPYIPTSSPLMFVNGSASQFNMPKVNPIQQQTASQVQVQNNQVYVLLNPPMSQPQPPPQQQQMLMFIPTVQQQPMAGPPISHQTLPNGGSQNTASKPENQNFCRHYMIGRCNRRKCRFLHPPLDRPNQDSQVLLPMLAPTTLTDSHDSFMSVNDISGSSSPFNSKSEMAGSGYTNLRDSDSVVTDSFFRRPS